MWCYKRGMDCNGNGTSRGRRGYKHGNLREALVKAELELTALKGAGLFAVAKAARAAGGSPAAPYRHVRDQGRPTPRAVFNRAAGPTWSLPVMSRPASRRCSRRASRLTSTMTSRRQAMQRSVC